jgi:hypothetical protein
MMNHRVSIDLFHYRIQILIQPEELDQKRFPNAIIEKGLSSLPEGKNPTRGLEDVSI